MREIAWDKWPLGEIEIGHDESANDALDDDGRALVQHSSAHPDDAPAETLKFRYPIDVELVLVRVIPLLDAVVLTVSGQLWHAKLLAACANWPLAGSS